MNCRVAEIGVITVLTVITAFGQNPGQSGNVPSQGVGTPLSVKEKWGNFVGETVSPLTLGAGVFNGGFAHLTNSDPKYGTNSEAFAQRFGASVADIATQNFFGDFFLAWAFHEDPRYFRKGPPSSKTSRFWYAVSRAMIIRRDAAGESFNWSNVLGTAMSAGFSNAYYPPAGRTGGAILIHFATSVAGAGFANLAPEFWPDFKQRFFSRQH
ncbi:MAG: hypothetical protein JOY62_04190 [Acidobacteriaceae bacterium]|nr:hypothetical protein [Acidobacteriaceae bacterium]MBV9779153.1 hypothetical protein [Acidobacteriaceae bacterium]